MGSDMHPQIRLERESFLADLTLVGFFTSVNLHVSSQRKILSKTFIAHFTSVWLHTIVTSYMSSQ
jgi:hypothetical protein